MKSGFAYNESLLKEQLTKVYNDYQANLSRIHPGNKELNDNYCKIVSLTESKNPFLKPPEEQFKNINKIKEAFKEAKNEKCKFLFWPISLSATSE